MTDTRTASLLAHLGALEERDLVLAARLEAVDELTARTASLRAQAAEVEAALAAHPAEVAAAREAEGLAGRETVESAARLDELERRIASFGRRTSQAERDQAERELARAREDVHDAEARAVRAAARLVELDERAVALHAEHEGIVAEARSVAGAIRAEERVADAGKGEPGETLASVEDWGARARAALFVARGTLATERERVVVEANTLGASVLGEPLGGSSVSLIRRRIEQDLGHGADAPG